LTDSDQDRFWMNQALDLAKQAEQQGEVPVGAIIVYQDQVVGAGYNQVISQHDPSAHAEIVALRQAGSKQQNYRLTGHTLYVTLEPCCMCAGALIHARVKRVVYATKDNKTGAAGSVFNVLNSDLHNHHVEISAGLCAEESAALVSGFFKKRRAAKKLQKSHQTDLCRKPSIHQLD